MTTNNHGQAGLSMDKQDWSKTAVSGRFASSLNVKNRLPEGRLRFYH
jgi:hypothetical protein